MQSIDEIYGMVVTGQGKLRECLDGLGLEPLSIKGFYLLGRFGQRIVIESGRDICIKLIIIGKIVFGVHKPLCIAKDGNLDITRVPKTQSYYKGVINLRGEICPIMSMRLKLGLEPDELTDKTRFIIVKVEGASIGVIVDQVKEVVTLEEEDIERISRSTNDDAAANYINAIGKKDGELISLLDIVSLIVENN